MNAQQQRHIDQLIKTATHFYLNKYQENATIYGEFTSALENIIFKYHPRLVFDPYHLFEIYFLPDDVAIVWINTSHDANAYKIFADMHLLSKEVAQLVTNEPADLSTYVVIDENNQHTLDAYELNRNNGIVAEDFDLLVNGHDPDIYQNGSINVKLLNAFLNALRETLYIESKHD